MKPTDFAFHLSKFLTDYLSGQRNLSTNTIKSYRDTYALLLLYLNDVHNIKPEKVSLNKMDSHMIEKFLIWLETDRKSSISTRNVRLAAIHAFFRYVQCEQPEMMFHCQKVIAIPFKKSQKPNIGYLSDESMAKLLKMPETSTANGRRDVVLLSTLYDTGARVQELINLTVRDVRFEKPAVVRLTGKGRKIRHVPIMEPSAKLLMQYLDEQKLTSAEKLNHPLFFNRQGEKLTRAGVAYILKKYAEQAGLASVFPHLFRHSKAMHLLQADVNLVYIRDFLGHSQLVTTEVYARTSDEMKRAALEKVHNKVVPSSMPNWNENHGLMDWLNNLCR